MKPLSKCHYDRVLGSLKLKLQRHPIKSSDLTKTSQSKLPSSLLYSNVYNLEQRPRSQRRLGKLNFLSTILSIGVTTTSRLYILDTVIMYTEFELNRMRHLD